MSILNEKIKNPIDIKKLSDDELNILCEEIREKIIDVVSKNGGHLASNLGVIELTIALLKEFDVNNDTIVWDVGHQTYAYKLLTGRYDEFETLRTCNGLSGFPKRCESKFDCFNTGHSSTSISAALGILRGEIIKGLNNKVIAVIGDGALTGGMAFEALNDAGQSGMDLIVILNDNEMSIGKNVGGMSKHLEAIRISKRYLNLKRKSYNILLKTGFGRWLIKIIERFKHLMRLFIRRRKVIFEDLGFQYYGPVDGHDLKDLQTHLSSIKKISGPILIHVITQKGKGYSFAENHPDKYHGVSPFEIENGLPGTIALDETKLKSFTEAFSCSLIRLAKKDRNICAVSAAMSTGTGLELFEKLFPDRFFDVGIAEQHALTMTAGMASVGLKPVLGIYSTFLQRGFDQILHDIALQNLHVVICIDRAGIVGEDGETHQGIYDLSLLMGVPNLTILSPRDFNELDHMLEYALYSCDGPVAIRYPKGTEPDFSEKFKNFGETENGLYTPSPVILEEGNDITFVTEGIMFSEVCKAAYMLKKDGISCDIIDIRKLKPFEANIILESAKKTKRVITVENAIKINGMGSCIQNSLFENNILASVMKLGIGDYPLCQGKISELLKQEGLDANSIYNLAKSFANVEKISWFTKICLKLMLLYCIFI